MLEWFSPHLTQQPTMQCKHHKAQCI
uniref:Uncharacterized protein n=1 Tax=Arundo donax TaxID=35708 RepID=A0A0A9FWX0_ARUDO